MTELLQPGETITDGRIRLSAATTADVNVMPWLETALVPDWTLDDLIACVEAGDGVLVSDAEGVAVGLMVVVRDRPVARAACVPFIAIEPLRRYRGLGGFAGLAIEKHLRDRLGVD